MSRTEFLNAANEIVRRPSVNVQIKDIADVTVTSFEHDSKNFDGFCIGNAVPQTLNFSVQGDMTDSLSNGKAVNITYFMGNVDSGCICPEFYITSYSYDAGSNTTKIVAKDGLYFLAEKKYPVSAGSLMTVGEYFESFCAGLGFGSQMLGGGLYSLPYPSGDAAANFSETDNALTVLRRVAEACCCNAYAGKEKYTDDNGETVTRNIIILSPYNSKKQAVITLNSVTDFTVSADAVPINRVVLSRGDLNDNTYLPETDPENISEIVITNNPILDNINQKIPDYNSRLDYIKKLYTYFTGIDVKDDSSESTVGETTSEEVIGQELISYSLNFRGNPGLTCGDVIRVCDRNGKYHNVVYFGSKLTFNNGMGADVTIEYNPTNTNSYSSGMSLSDAVKYAGIQVNKVDADIRALAANTNTNVDLLNSLLNQYNNALESKSDELNEIVKKLDGLEGSYSDLLVDSNKIAASITAINEGNAPGIKNTTVTISIDGITVGQTGANVITNINASGMKISNKAGEDVAVYNESGAEVPILQAKQLTVAGLLFTSDKVKNRGYAYWMGV